MGTQQPTIRSPRVDGAGLFWCEGRDAENGRLLNISEDVTSFHTLDDKGGAASENARRDGRAMRARKGAVEVQLLWARASGHISTRETGARCLGGSPPFEVTCLQRISCIPMWRPPQKGAKRQTCSTARNHPIVIVGTWFGGAPTMSAGGVGDGIKGHK